LKNRIAKLSNYPILSPVFERIHHGFFKPYLVQMRMTKAALQNMVNNHGQVFRGGDGGRELRQRIKVLMIEAFQNLGVHEPIQISQITNHARALIYRTANRDFERVVVPVSVGVVALALGRHIFDFRQGVAVQPMRCRKHVPPRQVCLHASP
jgi:hypothetical protein